MAATRRPRRPCPRPTRRRWSRPSASRCRAPRMPDRTSHRLTPKTHSPEPLQGWTQWCLDIEDIVSLCESEHAISTVQERNRDLLKALAREQPQLYAELGQAFVSRRERLAERRSAPKASSVSRIARARRPESFSLARWNMPELVLPRLKPKQLRERVNRSCPGHRAWVRRHRLLRPRLQARTRSNARMSAPALTAEQGSSRPTSGRSALCSPPPRAASDRGSGVRGADTRST